MNAREERGRLIAETTRIEKIGAFWVVPSVTGKGVYKVHLGRQTCTCPDHRELSTTCKHLFAVKFSLTKTEQLKNGDTVEQSVTVETTVRRKTYKQNWPVYNKAQVNEVRHFSELLRDLCSVLPAPAPRPGRPTLNPSDAAFCAISKVFSLKSARRFMGELDEAKTDGFIGHIPHFNSVLNWFDAEGTTETLREFITRTAAPLKAVETQFAVDSTGISSNSYSRWYSEKYGREEHLARWVKLHGLCGTKTHVIAAVELTDKHVHDTKMLPALVADTATRFDLQQVSADKAYASAANFAAVESVGGTFFPAFKRKTRALGGGSFEKAYHWFCYKQEEYLQYYHRRSNIESAFSMLKRKFGAAVKAKTWRAMVNETYAKVVCHNIAVLIASMYELGIDPKLAGLTACTKTETAAQQPALF